MAQKEKDKKKKKKKKKKNNNNNNNDYASLLFRVEGQKEIFNLV
jgi:hypothetical protein